MLILISLFIFLTIFASIVGSTNYVTNLKEDFSNNFDNEPIMIEKNLDNCEKRVWDETSEKGYKCVAPVPLNKLRYDAMNNVRYHDSIQDIKSQNPDYDLEFQNITLIDDNNNELNLKISKSQGFYKYNYPGKYKYGYNYVPKYHESVILSKLNDLAREELKENEKKLLNEYKL